MLSLVSKRFCVLVLSLVAFLAAQPSFAQNITGTITGTVTDSSGSNRAERFGVHHGPFDEVCRANGQGR